MMMMMMMIIIVIIIIIFCSVTLRPSPQEMNTPVNYIESAEVFEMKREGGCKEGWRKLYYDS
jgi:hypothetical protein